MISLRKLKKLGISLAVGDKGFTKLGMFKVESISNGGVVNVRFSDSFSGFFDLKYKNKDIVITSFAWRKHNESVQPVGDDVEIEVEWSDSEVFNNKAKYFDLDTGHECSVGLWRPLMRDLYQGATTDTGEPLGKAQKELAAKRESEMIMGNDYIGSNEFIEDAKKMMSMNTSAKVEDETNRTYAAVTTLKALGYTFDGGEQWKPPLVVKPVFTKEMADAGELPPVGSMVLCKDFEVEVVLGDDNLGVMVVSSKGTWHKVSKHDIRPILTERDIITNDMQDIISSQGHLHVGNITQQMADLLYDAGYRKSDK